MKRILRRITVAAATLLLCINSISADSYTGPEITGYYPAKANPELGYNVQDLKDTAKAYVYFTTGSKVLQAKAHICQNGETIGTCFYKNKAGGANATLDPKDADNADMSQIMPGEFTLVFYGVTWKNSEGEEQTWEEENADLGNVTYNRPGNSGKIVSETGFEDNKMLSYYPADSESGVKTMVFNKPVIEGSPRVSLIYGYGEMPYETPVEYTQSTDGLELTIDLRGKCYNADVLAPGATFYDVDGSVLPNPTKISLQITGLNCTDGGTIATQFNTVTLNGQAYYSWDYEDITLPNPKLTKAEFFSSTNPDTKYLNINADTDMMDLYIDNSSSLASADIVMKTGVIKETVPDSEIQKAEGIFTVELPASIRTAGSSGLTITLENYTMTSEDGAEHVIDPLKFDKVTNEYFSVEEVKEAEIGTKLVFVTGSLKITYSNPENLYTYGEDETGGLQFQSSSGNEVPFEYAKKIEGRISGKYMGENMFVVDEGESNFTSNDTDVSQGKEVLSIPDLQNEENRCRLVKFRLNPGITTTKDEDGTLYLQDSGNNILAVPALEKADFSWPENIKSITGVSDLMENTPFMLIRTPEDVEKDNETSVIESFMIEENQNEIYTIDGIRVESPIQPGLYIRNGKKVIVR